MNMRPAYRRALSVASGLVALLAGMTAIVAVAAPSQAATWTDVRAYCQTTVGGQACGRLQTSGPNSYRLVWQLTPASGKWMRREVYREYQIGAGSGDIPFCTGTCPRSTTPYTKIESGITGPMALKFGYSDAAGAHVLYAGYAYSVWSNQSSDCRTQADGRFCTHEQYGVDAIDGQLYDVDRVQMTTTPAAGHSVTPLQAEINQKGAVDKVFDLCQPSCQPRTSRYSWASPWVRSLDGQSTGIAITGDWRTSAGRTHIVAIDVDYTG